MAFYCVIHRTPFKFDLFSEDHKWMEGIERTPRVSILVSRLYLGTIVRPASRYDSLLWLGFQQLKSSSAEGILDLGRGPLDGGSALPKIGTS